MFVVAGLSAFSVSFISADPVIQAPQFVMPDEAPDVMAMINGMMTEEGFIELAKVGTLSWEISELLTQGKSADEKMAVYLTVLKAFLDGFEGREDILGEVLQGFNLKSSKIEAVAGKDATQRAAELEAILKDAEQTVTFATEVHHLTCGIAKHTPAKKKKRYKKKLDAAQKQAIFGD